MFSWLINYLTAGAGAWTYPLVFLLVMLDASLFIGFLLPGEAPVLIGGVLAGRGKVSLWGIGGLAAAGAIAGDSLGYWLGRWLGVRFAERWGPKFGVTRGSVERAEKFFEAHGRKAVFLGRFASVFRSIMPFVAGATRMPYGRFVAFNAPAGLVWAAIFVGLGFWAGEEWRAVARWVDRAGWVFIVGVVVALGARWLKGRRPGLVTGALLLLALLTPIAYAQQARDGGRRHDELPNFHRVSERLYRGAQPRKGGITRLAALGVNTIINLRDDDERAVAEEREAQSAGLRYYNVPFKRLGRPTDSQIERVLSLIEAPENGVVFVHCGRGANRTGTVVAIYRISHDGWTSREAQREAKRYGMKFWQHGMKDYISDYYRDRPLRLNPPRDERRGRSMLPRTLRWSGLPRGGAVGVS